MTLKQLNKQIQNSRMECPISDLDGLKKLLPLLIEAGYINSAGRVDFWIKTHRDNQAVKQEMIPTTISESK